MSRILIPIVIAVSLLAGGAQAKDTIVWWDFLGGGDGLRMKAMIDAFNKEHAGKVEIQATTLPNAAAFYSKVQDSASKGKAPDLVTYHASRIPAAAATSGLSELSPSELAASGIQASDFVDANWKAAQAPDGKQLAVPLDVHALVLYYNKPLLKKAGLLGDDGKPKGLDGLANWDAALAKLSAGGVAGLSAPLGDGGMTWRVFYTLLAQQGGVFFKDGKVLSGDDLTKAETAIAEMQKWKKTGWLPARDDYGAAMAAFTSGKAALLINGDWEVPTMVDLAKKGKLFDWGAVEVPTLYDNAATWADSHTLAIPNNQGAPPDAAKRKVVLDAIHWFNLHSLQWATGGHLPAFLPVRESAEFKAMKPNADYAALATTAAFDPAWTHAGVASPIYDAAGNDLVPAVNGNMDAIVAVTKMRDELQALAH